MGAWARGCVGAWVGRRGGEGGGMGMGGHGMGGHGMGGHGMGMGAVGWARLASLGFPIPNSDCRLGCDG